MKKLVIVASLLAIAPNAFGMLSAVSGMKSSSDLFRNVFKRGIADLPSFYYQKKAKIFLEEVKPLKNLKYVDIDKKRLKRYLQLREVNGGLINISQCEDLKRQELEDIGLDLDEYLWRYDSCQRLCNRCAQGYDCDWMIELDTYSKMVGQASIWLLSKVMKKPVPSSDVGDQDDFDSGECDKIVDGNLLEKVSVGNFVGEACNLPEQKQMEIVLRGSSSLAKAILEEPEMQEIIFDEIENSVKN